MRLQHSLWPRAGRAVLVAAAVWWAPVLPAQAQQALPPIVVEGATLAVKPAKPKAPPQAPDGEATEPATTAEDAPTVADSGATAPGSGSADAGASGGGSAVSLVTGQQIADGQIRYAGDALRGLPGVSVGRTGGFAGLTQVRIRGAEANHTLVLIDGVEANQPTNGQFDFSNLPAEDIARIEVIRGPQSGLFGSGAIGGVVNVVTKRGEGPLSIVGSAEGGAFGTSALTGTVSGGNRFIDGALTLHQRSTDGFNIAPEGRESDGARQELVAFKGGIRPFENFSLDVSIRRTMKRGDRDDEGGPAGALAVQTDTLSHFRWTTLLMGAEARLDTFGGFWTHAVRATRNRTTYWDALDLSIYPPLAGFGIYEDDSGTDKLAYLSTFRFASPGALAARHTVTAMVEREQETYTPVSRDNVERTHSRINVAAEWRGSFMDAVELAANVRHDNNERFEDFTTWRTSASWRLAGPVPGTFLRPHASVGTGVKYPTMFELFGEYPGPFSFAPNPNLKPEESVGWDAGVAWSSLDGRAMIDATFFSNDIRNQIDTVYDSSFVATPVNLAGISRHRGLETTARFRFAPDLTLALNHTYLDAETPDGLAATRRPRHSGGATLTAGFLDGRGRITLGAQYNGRMYDEALRLPFYSPERVMLDDYWLVSLAGSYAIDPHVELFGRVENLLDTQYQEVYGFQSAPIAAYAGVKVKLGGK